jgi:hypothetical protein
LTCQKICRDDVVNMDEVPSLYAITINGQDVVATCECEKRGDDTSIGRGLSVTINMVEIP